jgi:AraC-like DNA-binding protein
MLKRFIIKCTRLAKQQFAEQASSVSEFDLVRNFSMLVDKNFRNLHRVNEYADLLNKSSKTLSNAFKALGEKSPLQIIHERIILEAKKLLIYTDKSAKEIAFELGFTDPVQFARLFKNETGYAPVEFKKVDFYHEVGKIAKQ